MFDKPGKGNTQTTLGAARQRAEELGVGHLILTTSTGGTAFKAAGVKLNAVPNRLAVSAGSR